MSHPSLEYQESRSSRHRFHIWTNPMSPVHKPMDQSDLTDHLKRSADYMPASPGRAGRSLESGLMWRRWSLSAHRFYPADYLPPLLENVLLLSRFPFVMLPFANLELHTQTALQDTP